MKLKLIQKKANYPSFLILLASILFISGCVSQEIVGENVTNQSVSEIAVQPVGENVTNQSVSEIAVQPAQGLQIVVKDVGFPEVKYLQLIIKEVQLQDESGKWTTIWSSPEGKTVKLTPDGAEVLLDTVSVKAGSYIGTKLMVSTIEVEADINRDGDTSDKNVEIILTEKEFQSLPQKEKPQAPQKPQAPEKPSAPQKPQAPEITGAATDDQQPPQEPEKPPEPQEPQAPYRIEGGLVYTGEYLDEKHTVTLSDYIVPLFEDKFIYGGSGGKIVYDFTLYPLLPKHEQISVEVFTIPSPPKPPTIILFDDFNGATKGEGFGVLTYEDSPPNLDKAVNLAKGNYIKYSFSPWYRWDGVHSWNRNEAAPGVLTEGSIGMWIKPRQYSGILTLQWFDTTSAPGSGYIGHFSLNSDGKLVWGVWGGNMDMAPVGQTTIPLNEWTRVAVSWGPSGTKLYVNGKVDASTSANVWPAFSGTVFAYLNYWGENDFGFVDDFHISKVAEPSTTNISIIVNPATVLPTTALLDDFNGATKGEGFGVLTYEDSPPNLDKAVNLAKGNYIKYSFSPWYRWDGVHSWNRNEAASGVLTEGSIGMWIKPRQYSGILTLQWFDTTSAPGSGYIGHFSLNSDGKLVWGVWGGNMDMAPVGQTTIPLNEWTRVAVSWSPSGTKLYVNGKVDASTSANMWPAFSGSTQYVYLNYWGDSDFGLVDDLHILKVAEPPTIVPPEIIIIVPPIIIIVPPIIITENITKNVTANITANVTADVKISSLTCGWTSKLDKYGYKQDYFQAIAKGTAQGPVGTRLELPILYWGHDKFDCGNWTHSTGALIAVGSTCTRKAEQPETTTWTADTGGEETITKGYFKNKSYSVKIYKGNEIYPQTGDNKTAPCQ